MPEQTIYRQHGWGKPPEDRRLGVEIEVERWHGGGALGWDTKGDDSLRDCGAEFITPPTDYGGMFSLINSFYEQFHARKWRSSIRTGIHVHVEASDYTVDDLASLVACNVLIEPGLMEYVGAEREECIYCVPSYRAVNDIRYIARELKRVTEDYENLAQAICNISCHTSKYAGVYYEPLRRFGTVEYRMAPTWTEARTLWRWVSALWNTVNHCYGLQPLEILEQYEARGAYGFFHHVTGGMLDIGTEAEYNARMLGLPSEMLAELVLEPWLDTTSLEDGWVSVETMSSLSYDRQKRSDPFAISMDSQTILDLMAQYPPEWDDEQEQEEDFG